jgi:hypothetical protein
MVVLGLVEQRLKAVQGTGGRPHSGQVDKRPSQRGRVPGAMSWADEQTQPCVDQEEGGSAMALGIYFVHEGFTPEKYDSAIKKLEAAGAGQPKGRTCHCALESNGEIQVFDIWESQADFDAFGPTLMPILTELGVGLKEPMVATVHNVITG